DRTLREELLARDSRLRQLDTDPLARRTRIRRHRRQSRPPGADVPQAAEQRRQAFGFGEDELVAREAQLAPLRHTLELLQAALRRGKLEPQPPASGAGPHPAAKERDLGGGTEVDLQRRQRALRRDRFWKEEVPSAVDEMDVLPQPARAVDLIPQPQRHSPTSAAKAEEQFARHSAVSKTVPLRKEMPCSRRRAGKGHAQGVTRVSPR